MFGDIALERKLLEQTYHGVMTVIGARKETVDGETDVIPDALLYRDAPCALSSGGNAKTEQTDDAGRVTAQAKIFCAPELVLPPGSQIDVTQDGQTRRFGYSGEAFSYPTHQELTVQREGFT